MYLIIGVATLSTLTLTFLALLVYRRLVRRQRRRTIGVSYRVHCAIYQSQLPGAF